MNIDLDGRESVSPRQSNEVQASSTRSNQFSRWVAISPTKSKLVKVTGEGCSFRLRGRGGLKVKTKFFVPGVISDYLCAA